MISALLIASMLAAPPKEPRPAAAAAPENAGLAKAKELVQWGQKLYKQARYAEAIAKFEEAYLARPSPVITYNIGKCYEQLGETAKAMRAYRDYLRLSPNAADRETVSDAITNLERRLREKGLQQLMVFADPPTAKISVDGKELGNSPVSIELVAGNHTLSVTAEGHEKVDRAFVMQLARATEMNLPYMRALRAFLSRGCTKLVTREVAAVTAGNATANVLVRSAEAPPALKCKPGSF